MSHYTDKDRCFMQQALRLAEKVKGTTFPNPAVGAIVVNKGKIVGSGATRPYGGLHAEKIALQKAGCRSRNALLYVTLEPCCHFGQTSPCTDAIIEAQIKKVIIAVKDPNPLVNGRGIRYLRKKNIDVSVGCMSWEASLLNEDFFWAITQKQPWITVKLATTLDGRIADIKGNAKWITNTKSRTCVHSIRRKHAAIAVGRETLIKDNPQLTVRHVRGTSPIRIVFTSDPNISEKYYIRKNTGTYRSIIVCKGGIKSTKNVLDNSMEVWYTGFKRSSEHLRSFLNMAYAEGITSILIEGGRKLASSFLEYKLVNRLYIFYGNKILGAGIEGFSLHNHLKLDTAIRLTHIQTDRFDDNVMVTGIPCWED